RRCVPARCQKRPKGGSALRMIARHRASSARAGDPGCEIVLKPPPRGKPRLASLGVMANIATGYAAERSSPELDATLDSASEGCSGDNARSLAAAADSAKGRKTVQQVP